MTIVKEPVREAVPQGPLKTPFYPRVAKLDTVNQWHEWKGYSSPDALFCKGQTWPRRIRCVVRRSGSGHRRWHHLSPA
jgi:hypothetical protein